MLLSYGLLAVGEMGLAGYTALLLGAFAGAGAAVLAVTGVLAAVITAFCGPVAFIGLAVPHIARLFLKSNNHRLLLPGTMITGAAVALLCNIICQLPGESGLLPLGAITPLIGAPVIIYVVLRSKGV